MEGVGALSGEVSGQCFQALGRILRRMLKDVSRYFHVGEKVYPTKIDVNVNKAKVSFTVVACDSCSGTNPPTSMKGEVVFQ